MKETQGRMEDLPGKSQSTQVAADPGAVPRWKRVLDIACVVVAAPAWIPIGVLIAVVIKIVSSGPVFFTQERIGHMGKRFRCFKFRSMETDADVKSHEAYAKQLPGSDRPMTKLDLMGDPRLIPGGLMLRALGLDELPQLINVLRGEMSLVGPRPCVPYEFAQYRPRDRRRCETLPGLTGLWQISGKNRTTFDEMINLDLDYVARKSPLLDLRIIAWTLPAIVVQTWEARGRRQSRNLAVRGG